jgi:hypothetical protein
MTFARSATARVGRSRLPFAFFATAALLAVLPSVARADVTFKAPVAYATPAGGQDVAVGDFNKDGKLDLATANRNDSSFSILLGNGDGTFQAQTRFAVATGGPTRIVVGDFDGDSNPDLALAMSGTNRAVVEWGTGTGTGFDGTNSVAVTASTPGSVGAADLGIGRDELLSTNPAGGELSVAIADPLTRVFGTRTDTIVGSGPDQVASGNLYGETDVVVTFPGPGSVRFERGNGAGGFISGGGGSYGVGAPPIGASNPNDVAVADVTGDGKGDMLTSNPGTNTATILPSVATPPTNQQNTALPAGAAPTGITTGDFTGDGLHDAAVVDNGLSEVTVLQGGAPGARTPMTIVGSYPAGSGVQRAEAGDFNGDGAADLAVSSTNNGGEVHVLMSHGAPALAGQASASVAIGGSVSDTATLSGATPDAGGSITFRLYAPGDATCDVPRATQTVSVSGNGSYSNPTPVTPDTAGTYRWVASYSGDTNNDAASTDCSDTDQQTDLTKAATTVTASVPSSITLGASITASATLGGSYGDSSGDVVWQAYTSDDCSGTAVYTSDPTTVQVAHVYTDAPYTPSTAGTYSWVAHYSGDGDNQAADSTCAASGSVTTVDKASTTLSLTATHAITVGSDVTLSATLGGGHSPIGGNVRFDAYANGTCNGAPTWTSPDVAVTATGAYGPADPFAPAGAGTYSVAAVYTGDANNTQSTSGCTVVTVAKATPTLSVAVPGTISLGADDGATATLGGTWHGGGTVTFAAYPTADCSGTPAYTGGAPMVEGDGAYVATPVFVPSAAGTYRWIATYSGDANDESAATTCGAASSATNVTQAGLSVTPSGGYGSVLLHQRVTRTFTVTNTSSGATAEPLAFGAGGVSIAGRGFAVAADGCGGRTIAPGAQCAFRVAFAPTVAGAVHGAVTLTSNAAGSPTTVALSGTGVTPVKLSGLTVTRCLGTAKGAKRSVTVGYAVNTTARVTFTLQHRVAPIATRRTCPKTQLAGTPGEYVDVRATGRRAVASRARAAHAEVATPVLSATVSVGAGAHTFALKTLLHGQTLKAGRYRVLVQAAGPAGGRSQASVYFTVLKAAKKAKG